MNISCGSAPNNYQDFLKLVERTSEQGGGKKKVKVELCRLNLACVLSIEPCMDKVEFKA